MTTIQFPISLPTVDLEGLQADPAVRDANAQRFNSDKHVDECFLCGRGLTAKATENGWMVHLHVMGYLLHKDEDLDDRNGSQGWFPVGSECAKKIPATHKARV